MAETGGNSGGDGAPRSAWFTGAAVGVVVVLLLGVALFTGVARNSGRNNPYKYDSEKYEKTDPALLKYKQVGKLEPGMREPRAIAVAADGRALVAGDRMVRCFNAKGEQEAEWTVDGAPAALFFGAERFYVVFDQSVEVYDFGRKRIAAWSEFGPKARLTGGVEAGEHVWLTDSGRKALLKCSREGRVISELGAANEADPEGFVVYKTRMAAAVGVVKGEVASGQERTFWVSNPGKHRVEEWRTDGIRLRAWGGSGMQIERFSSCCNPCALAVLPDGDIVTAEHALPRVKVYSPEGKLQSVVAGVELLRGNMQDEKTPNKPQLNLAADSAGRIYVLDPAEGAVRIFKRKE
jgi:hypothetical protein